MADDFRTFCLRTLSKEDEKIDLKLIEDFAFISKTEEKFPIPIEKLVEWGMDLRRDHALGRLNKSFVLNVDFSQTFGKTSAEGGRPRKLTNLSVNCFKMLCAQTNNEKGKMLLHYLLIVERLWKEYMQTKFNSIQEEKDKLLNQLQEEQNQLKDERKNHRDLQTKYTRAYGRRYHTKIAPKGPTFYVVAQDPLVKIGICGCRINKPGSTDAQSLDSRLANHRGLWPQLRVKFIVYSEDAPMIESMMKRIYRMKTTSTSYEVIEGVTVDEVIQTCKSILQLLVMHEEKSTFRIEERLELFNPEEDENVKAVCSESSPSLLNPDIVSIPVQDEKSDKVEIKHNKYTRTEIQSFLDGLPKLNKNEIKILCRKFKILMNKRKKSVLADELRILFQKALGQVSENTRNEKEDELPEVISTSYDPENLPKGLSFIRKNGTTLGLKLTVGLGGSTYESTFRDRTKSMPDRFQEALQLQQDLISEFKQTGMINWESHKKQKVVRLGVCLDCGVEIGKASSICQSCSSKQKSARPPKDRLLAMLRERNGNLSAVGRDLHRSDVAVRKWLRHYGFTDEEINKRTFLPQNEAKIVFQ